MRSLLTVSIFFIIAVVTSCSKPVEKSAAKDIVAFYLRNIDGSPLDTSKIEVSITGDSINILVAAGTDLSGYLPDIQITGISISPSTLVPQDFTKPVTYTVTAEDGSTKNYYVTLGYQSPKNIVFVGSSDKNFYALDALSGKLIWKYTGGGWFSYASPSSANGIVYAGCTDNNVYAFDAVTGKVDWKFTTGGAIESSLALADNIVYAGSDDDYMYALDATTGEMKWSLRTAGNVSSRAAVLNGIVYFGSDDGFLYALDAVTGTFKWKYPMASIPNQSGVTISDGIVFAGDRGGSLYALDAISGDLKWKFNTGGISLEESTPAVYNGLVYIAGWYSWTSGPTPGSVYAIDESTGLLRWESLKGLGFSASPHIAEGTLYISADDGNFYALDAASGNVLWNKTILPNGAGATVVNNVIYVGGGGTHFIYALGVSGSEIWKFEVGSEGITTSTPCVIGSEGQVYSSGNLFLQKIKPKGLKK